MIIIKLTNRYRKISSERATEFFKGTGDMKKGIHMVSYGMKGELSSGMWRGTVWFCRGI